MNKYIIPAMVLIALSYNSSVFAEGLDGILGEQCTANSNHALFVCPSIEDTMNTLYADYRPPPATVNTNKPSAGDDDRNIEGSSQGDSGDVIFPPVTPGIF